VSVLWRSKFIPFQVDFFTVNQRCSQLSKAICQQAGSDSSDFLAQDSASSLVIFWLPGTKNSSSVTLTKGLSIEWCITVTVIKYGTKIYPIFSPAEANEPRNSDF